MVARFLLALTAAVIIFSAPLAASSHINSISPLSATAAAVLAALPARRGRRYLRKRQVAARYGVDERTVDRMAKDGRLPPYIYLPGSKLPLQDEDELDRRDDAAAAARTTGKPVAALETRDGA
jgi:hypothetical protein